MEKKIKDADMADEAAFVEMEKGLLEGLNEYSHDACGILDTQAETCIEREEYFSQNFGYVADNQSYY